MYVCRYMGTSYVIIEAGPSLGHETLLIVMTTVNKCICFYDVSYYFCKVKGILKIHCSIAGDCTLCPQTLQHSV